MEQTSMLWVPKTYAICADVLWGAIGLVRGWQVFALPGVR
jgi:hypothetical protein